MLVQGVTSAADRVAKEVDLDQVVAAAVVATQEAIYFFGYKDLQVSGASPAQILRQTDADGKTILGPIDPLDPIRASIEDLRDNVDDRIYYFGSKDLVTTDLDPSPILRSSCRGSTGMGLQRSASFLSAIGAPPLLPAMPMPSIRTARVFASRPRVMWFAAMSGNGDGGVRSHNGSWRIFSHPDQALRVIEPSPLNHEDHSHRRPRPVSQRGQLRRCRCSRRRPFVRPGSQL